MCGVFGYVGAETAVGEAVLSALKTLEYRGYDSWGLALAANGEILVDKAIGRIDGYRSDYPRSTVGLGHTRWATHGGVTACNAHPHLDCSRRIAVVHNGIIENHLDLAAELRARGHAFASETDSEVVAHLIEERLHSGVDLARAVGDAFRQIEGYNAIVVMDLVTQQIAAVKHVSPLVIGQGSGASTIASDAIALHDHAERLTHLEDDQLAVLSTAGTQVLDLASLQPATTRAIPIEDADRDPGLGTFPDFMLKEISEQPAALARIVHEGRGEIEALAAAVRDAKRTVLVGCGTAGHAALAGAYFFSELANREVIEIPASEFRYRSHALDGETLVVALSQSGETVDVLDAATTSKRRGARLAAVVNTRNSSLDRMADLSVHLGVGVERCVLATKSYTAKLAVLLMTAACLDGHWDAASRAVLAAAGGIESVLRGDVRDCVRRIAVAQAASPHLFVIGRGIHYPSALEAALKIKEVSYIHAEGFASGELKHGVIALIAAGTPCVVIAPDDETRTDVLSGAAELRSRGGHIIGIGSRRDPVFDEYIAIPDVGLANPIAEAVAGQLFGYFAALARGNDPDRPRNLAKSVTVK